MTTLPDIQRIDSSDMRGFIAHMGAHIRDAIASTKEALVAVEPRAEYANIVICGIGGSAIAGDLVRSYLKELRVPIVVQRGYELPALASDRSLIVVSSYSGNTEESLALFEEAVSRKFNIVAITTGGTLRARASGLGIPILPQQAGMQPRAALAYGFVPLLLLIEHLGLTSNEESRLLAPAEALDRIAATESNAGSSSYELAQQLTSRIAVIYSADDVLGSVGIRWRGQIQENAKHRAFSSVLPEMNHNEINAWQHPADLLDRTMVVALRSPEDEHKRVQLRFSILKEYLTDQGVLYHELTGAGSTRLERMFSLIALGDWTSYWLAILTNTDPTPIPAIDYLKKRLA